MMCSEYVTSELRELLRQVNNEYLLAEDLYTHQLCVDRALHPAREYRLHGNDAPSKQRLRPIAVRRPLGSVAIIRY